MSEIPKFSELSKEVQEKIKAKARWERMSLMAVMEEWPDLWRNTSPSKEGEA